MTEGLEKKIGPLRIRAWGLMANFIANVVMLYGLAGVLNSNGGWPALILGTVATLTCIAILAKPS